MSTQTFQPSGVEPSEQDLRYGIFVEIDTRARQIEKLWKETWVEVAELCMSMRDGSYWREGGFTSYNSWLLSAMPCSRSWAYLAVGVREELKDLAAEDLKQMPLANAEVLRKLPKVARRAKEVIESAQNLTPNQFLPHIASERPELCLEAKVKRYRVYTVSQLNKIDEGMNRWRELNPGTPLSDADIEEYMWAEYLLEHQSEGVNGEAEARQPI